MSGRVVPLEEAAAAATDDSVAGSSRSGASCFWIVLRFCNTFAVAILAVCVTFLFLQLQYLTYTVTQQEQKLSDLKTTVQSQQQAQEDISQQVEQEHSLTVYQAAGTFTLLTCLITMFHMSSHLRNFHEKAVQTKIITILWMSPIYAVTSFLGLVFPAADGYLAVIKDFYEAYVVYTFLAFLIAVLGRGNRDVVVDVLAQQADHLDKPFRCLSRWYHPPPETSDRAMANAVIMECQILAMQFVLVRPLTSIASFVSTQLMEQRNNANADDQWAYFKSPNFYIAMVTNVSVFLAFTGLLKFYHAVREELSWCQPFFKFLAIKGIVFLTFWQGLLISIIVNFTAEDETDNANDSDADNPREQAVRIQNVLICMEMLFFSIAHWCVFPAEEWEAGYRPKQYAKPGIGLKDFVSDVSYMAKSYRRKNGAATAVLGDDDDVEQGEAVPTALEEEDEPYQQARLQAQLQ